MDTTHSEISIRDLGLAAALIGCGFEITRTRRDPGGRAYFIFLQMDEAEEVIKQYWANTLRVRARQYSDDIKMLKGRIYADQ